MEKKKNELTLTVCDLSVLLYFRFSAKLEEKKKKEEERKQKEEQKQKEEEEKVISHSKNQALLSMWR